MWANIKFEEKLIKKDLWSFYHRYMATEWISTIYHTISPAIIFWSGNFRLFCFWYMELFQGKNVEYVHQDDNNRRWFNEFRSKSSSIPIAFETVDCECTCNALVPITNVLMYQDIQEILRLTIYSRSILVLRGQLMFGMINFPESDHYSLKHYFMF